MVADIKTIAKRVDNLKMRHAERDARMQQIQAVRKGNMVEVFPELFPEGMPHSMVANFIDVAARDLAEVLAPLPSFNCSTVSVANAKARAFADKRGMIANNYVFNSRLQSQMYWGADWYFSYGFLPIHVEPDFEDNLPRIRVEDPMGSYPEFDRFGRCVAYAKRYLKTTHELANEFPEHAPILLGRLGYDQNNMEIELIKYMDKDQTVLYVPSRNNLILSSVRNPLGKMMVRIARRPGIDEESRGQFDDVIYVQMARARFANLAMEAAEKSIQAPFVVPNDVIDLPMGPDAIIRTANPQGVGRVKLDIPAATFQEQSALQSELRLGARYPEGRTGNIDASIITGQGVQALLGAFDSQIKAGQTILAEVFEDVIKVCFEVDEMLFDEDKSVRGTAQGTPYELKYKPSKDINGDTSIEVRYGLMAGLDPSRALIFSLQALGADLVSKDFIRRELPWNVNVTLEEQRIEIEKMRDNLTASITATAQAIPAMVAQGQDPSALIRSIADVIERRRKGENIEDAALAVFTPPKPEQPMQPETAPPGTQGPVEQAPPSPATPGQPSGGAPQQAAPPQDLASILATMG
ncbi:MAG: hypothetical protein EBR60_06705 [Burkholderiaceae bacterium]|nr:hypothetical protein [Burkholderiaceae bacterium]